MPILVATDREVVVIDVERGTSVSARGIGDRPTCLAADALVHGPAWCGTHRDGVFRTDDGGRSWRSVGLAGRLIMAIAASPVERDVVWAGTEPTEERETTKHPAFTDVRTTAQRPADAIRELLVVRHPAPRY